MNLSASTNRRSKDVGTKPKGEWPGSVYIHHELGGLAEVAGALGATGHVQSQ
jgi:hypothetical protein